MHRSLAAVLLLTLTAFTAIQSDRLCRAGYPGPAPGPASARVDGDKIILENRALRAVWSTNGARLQWIEMTNRAESQSLLRQGVEPFWLKLRDGRTIAAGDLRLSGPAEIEKPARQTAQTRDISAAEWSVQIPFSIPNSKVRVTWRAALCDEAHFIRQSITLSDEGGSVAVSEATLLKLPAPQARVIGAVDGSPIQTGSFFLGCEHPMARNRVADGQIDCSTVRYGLADQPAPWEVSAVVGVFPPNQLRRAFLDYLERVRARAYKPFVYYISWFDIAAPGYKMNEGQCLNVIKEFGGELSRRNAAPDAFVFDDGWDDTMTLWAFHDGFPQGFKPVRDAAAKFSAVLGTWISPWGGYGEAKKQRLQFGREQGFEANRQGFSLAGPKYAARFRDVCRRMLQEQGVQYLKFDGIGSGTFASGASEEFTTDLDALLRLLVELRQIQPNLFVNATVGTWPSPWWLRYSDSIWRGGGDMELQKTAGTARQRWITYRDKLGYDIRTIRGPLYPFNSLKFQSVICARLSLAAKLNNDEKDLIDDIRMAVGSGTQMQEYFVTPSLFTPRLWDVTAEAILWMRRNADVLVDSHGIGGDPGKSEVYGFASWSPRAGIVVLRNPSDKPAQYDLDVQTAFELPPGAAQSYAVQSPWREEQKRPALTLQAGQPTRIDLAPWQVLVFEATPIPATSGR